MNTPLIDAAARERIRTQHDETLFVVAGAGTGKTSALVGRIVALVAQGRTDLSDLAAITFTEAAAGELRDRVRTALEAAGRGDDHEVAHSIQQQRCAAARLRVDDAALCTLHAFAQRIIAIAPLEAGVPPRFEVVDEIEAAMNFADRWSRLLDTLLGREELEPTIIRGLLLGARLSDWRAIANALHAQWDRIGEPAFRPPASLPDIDIAALVAAIDSLLELQQHCDDPDDKLLACIEEYRSIRALLTQSHDLDLIDALRGEFRSTKNGRKCSWAIPKEQVQSVLTSVIARRDAMIQEQSDSIFEIVTPYIQQWCLDAAAQRRADGRLEFHDLLVLARNLLHNETRVRTVIAQRYQYLLIDEFQDTDPLQIELATALAANAIEVTASGSTQLDAWESAEITAGRLFFVGDPKQSIYRFRRADLALYQRAQLTFEAGSIALTQNFRSVPAIIDWVNTTFDAALNADTKGGLQAQPMALTAHRMAIAGPGPGVATFGSPSAERAADLRVAEANDIAEIVLDAVGNWSVFDPSLGGERPARRADIAILLPTRAALDAIDNAFDAADITVRIESRSLVFSTSEVRDLLTLLEAIHDPGDSIAVVASLRTPGFACTDTSLAEWSVAGGTWDYRQAAPESLHVDHPVAVAFATMLGFHQRRFWTVVSDLILAIIDELQLDAFATFHRRPRDRWRRLRFLVHHARVWDSNTHGRGLGGFIQWARQQSEEGASAVEVPVPERDDDAVRILTIHGSKGLEFPIVILAGVGASPAIRLAPVLWGPGGPEYNAGTNAARVASSGYAPLRVAESGNEVAERTRLLYVATTRARDHLVVSRHHNSTRASRSPAAILEPHLQLAAAVQLDCGATNEREPTGTAPPSTASAGPHATPHAAPLGAPLASSLVGIDTQLATRTEALSRAAQPDALSATTIAQQLRRDSFGEGKLDELTDSDRAAWQRGRAGSAIGRAVHGVLQFCNLHDGSDIDVLAYEQASAEHIADRADEIIALTRGIHQNRAFQQLISAPYWREIPVAAAVHGRVIEGYIDVLIDTPEGLIIIDYKTDSLAAGDGLDAALDHAVERYAPQAATYAIAVELALGRPVVAAHFLFARNDGAILRTVEDLEQHKARVEQHLSATRYQSVGL